MSAATATPLRPPAGYPFDQWQDDGLYEVAPDLRAEYIAQAEAGRGSEKTWWSDVQQLKPHATVPDDDTGQLETVPADYPLWAHIDRRDSARRVQKSAAAAADSDRRYNVNCAVCGNRNFYAVMVRVQVAGVSAYACPADGPALQLELRARERLADGRTRQQWVADAADRLLG